MRSRNHHDLKTKTLDHFKQYHLNYDVQSRNEIVTNNMGLVRRQAHCWKIRCQVPYDELLQVGSVGLIKAVEGFETELGFTFSTYAIKFIDGEIKHYLRDKAGIIRLDRKWHKRILANKKNIDRIYGEKGREPSDEELRLEMKLSLEDWRQFQIAKQNTSVSSLDAPAFNVDSCTVGELLIDDRYSASLMNDDQRYLLQESMSTLDERTRKVVELIYYQGMKQSEVAKYLGIHVATVHREIRKGKKLIKEFIDNLQPQQTTETTRLKKPPQKRLGRPPGLKQSKLDPFRGEIEALLSKGVTQSLIARRYNTTDANLHQWLKRRGLLKRPKKPLNH